MVNMSENKVTSSSFSSSFVRINNRLIALFFIFFRANYRHKKFHGLPENQLSGMDRFGAHWEEQPRSNNSRHQTESQ